MGIVRIFLILTILTDPDVLGLVSCNTSTICFLQKSSHTNSDVCIDNSDPLSCTGGKLIKINLIRYEKRTVGAKNCDDCSKKFDDADWQTKQIFFQDRLFQSCSQKNMCSFNESVKKSSGEENDQDYLWHANITYNCIETATVKDFCSPLNMTYNWWKTLHLTLSSTTDIAGSCSCVIEGEFRTFIVDYRPYFNDVECSDTTLFVDEQQIYICTRGEPSSVFNIELNVSNGRQNITVLTLDHPAHMFWLMIRVKPSAHVECQASYTTTSTILTETITSTSTPRPTPSSSLSASSQTPEKSTSLSLQTDDESTEFPVSAVVSGTVGSVALILIVLITYILCKRRSRSMSNTTNKENDNNEVQYDAGTSGKSRIINGAMNNTYGNGCEMTDTTSRSSLNYQEIDSTNIYSEPADTIDVDINVEPGETVGNMQNAHTAKKEGHNYQEPYQKSLLTRDNERQLNYAKVVKDEEKKDVYNTLSGIDNYSHIHVLPDNQAPKFLDNYSHIKLGQSEENEIIQAKSTDMYSHFKVDNNQQDMSDNVEYQSIKGGNTNVETEEYDHLAHYSHH